MAAMHEKLRRRLVNMLLVVVSVTVPLIALECYLHWNNRRPDANEYLSDVTLNGEKYRFLASPHDIHDPANALLIAGDSFTAGLACADDRTYPSAFTRAAAQSGSTLRSVNMGVVGSGPMSYVARIQDYLTEKNSAAGVVITLYANDVELDCFACQRRNDWAPLAGLTADNEHELDLLCAPCVAPDSQRAPDEVAGSVSTLRRFNWWMAENFLTYSIVREGIAKASIAAGLLSKEWGRVSYPKRWADQKGVYFKYIQGSIALAKSETQRRGIPMMVVLFPDSMELTTENPFFAIYEDASAALRKHSGAPVYSGYEAFVGNPRSSKNMAFSLTDTHPSCEANEIFGKWVFGKWSALIQADSDPHPSKVEFAKLDADP